MDNYSFDLAWNDEDSAYVATCPELPGLSGLAPTPEGALGELRTAIELALETYEEEGRQPPEPRSLPSYSGQFRLRLPKSLHRALALRSDVEDVSLNTLAITYIAQGLGFAEAALRAMNQYARFEEWCQTLPNRIPSSFVRYYLKASGETSYLSAFQDPLLTSLNSQQDTLTTK